MKPQDNNLGLKFSITCITMYVAYVDIGQALMYIERTFHSEAVFLKLSLLRHFRKTLTMQAADEPCRSQLKL